MTTPQLITRPGTIDADVVRCVIEANEYRLPDRMDGWTVVDVGAHIGSFAVACMMRGARRVLCFEPDKDNAQLCRLNTLNVCKSQTKWTTEWFDCEVEVFRLAVWSQRDHALSLGGYPTYQQGDAEMFNTGGASISGNSPQQPNTLAVPLAAILRMCGKVDLLKLDCEGSEWEILDHTGNLSMAERICGEYHSAGQPADTGMASLLAPAFTVLEITPASPNGFFWCGEELWWK